MCAWEEVCGGACSCSINLVRILLSTNLLQARPKPRREVSGLKRSSGVSDVVDLNSRCIIDDGSGGEEGEVLRDDEGGMACRNVILSSDRPTRRTSCTRLSKTA